MDTKHLFVHCFNRGFRDFRKGVLTLPTNYKAGSFYAKEWERGQNAAYFINLNYVRQREGRRK